ncbi:MAG: hypothetical protein F4Y03_04210 [Alphaproteobacteria bacterium]|nr:hypothetical protein [Alphaproteobacteria bacterium]
MSWPDPLAACIAGLLLGAVLAGCTLEPVHARRPQQGADVTTAMAQVEVDPIPDRVGFLLRRRLEERLAPKGLQGPARYRLQVRLRSMSAGALVGRSDRVTRSDLTLTADFRLFERGSERPVLESWARSVHSHDVRESAFATRAAEQAARERGVDALSARIARRLALFFRSGEQAG